MYRRLPTTARIPTLPRRSSRFCTLLSSSSWRSRIPSTWYGNGNAHEQRLPRSTSPVIRRTGDRGWTDGGFDARSDADGCTTTATRGTVCAFTGGGTACRAVYECASGGCEWAGTDDQPGEDEDDGHVGKQEERYTDQQRKRRRNKTTTPKARPDGFVERERDRDSGSGMSPTLFLRCRRGHRCCSITQLRAWVFIYDFRAYADDTARSEREGAVDGHRTGLLPSCAGQDLNWSITESFGKHRSLRRRRVHNQNWLAATTVLMVLLPPRPF